MRGRPGPRRRGGGSVAADSTDSGGGEGVLAFTDAQIRRRTGRLGRALARYQAWLFFPLLTLEGLNLHVASARAVFGHSRRRHRRTEIILLTLHLTGYLAAMLLVLSPVKALAIIAIHQGVFGLYMGCSFAPNHKGMPIIPASADIDYLRRQVLTSRNVRGGPFIDLLLGGLNYQVEHHLFPSMPRPSLRRAQTIVRSYCQQLELPYTETSLLTSYRAALRHLHTPGGGERSSLRSSRRRRIPAPPAWRASSGRASGYIAEFMRATNAIYNLEEGRLIWRPRRCG